MLSKTDIFFTSSLLLCCGKHVSALFNVLPASSLGCLWTPLVSIHHPFLPISAPARDVQKNKSNKTSVSLTPKGVAAAGSTWFVTITSPINASMIMKSCQVFRVMSRCLLPSCGQRCPAPAQTMVRSGRRLGAQLVTRDRVIIQFALSALHQLHVLCAASSSLAHHNLLRLLVLAIKADAALAAFTL